MAEDWSEFGRNVERGVTCGMMLGHTGRSSGFSGQELLFAYTQSTPTFPPFLPPFRCSAHTPACPPGGLGVPGFACVALVKLKK